jgi:hypothetical protein
VVPDQGVLDCEHHTFICSECHVTERHAVFIKNGREYESRPSPADLPPAVLPALSVEQDRVRIPNSLRPMVTNSNVLALRRIIGPSSKCLQDLWFVCVVKSRMNDFA